MWLRKHALISKVIHWKTHYFDIYLAKTKETFYFTPVCNTITLENDVNGLIDNVFKKKVCEGTKLSICFFYKNTVFCYKPRIILVLSFRINAWRFLKKAFYICLYF